MMTLHHNVLWCTINCEKIVTSELVKPTFMFIRSEE